jgi:hypothetical protein
MSRERIDGIMALIMGLDRPSRQQACERLRQAGPLFIMTSDK